MRTTFRVNISDEDFDWIQDYKEKMNLKSNIQFFDHLKNLAQEEVQLKEQLADVKDLRKQQRFTKEQVAILIEMVSEFLMTQGMQIVGNGIDAEIYKSAKKKVKERINNRMEENGGQLE